MERIELKPRYVRRARDLAVERNKSFEENDNWNNDIETWGTRPEERNYLGLLGEFAFAKYSGLQLDTDEYDKTDGGGDFEAEYSGTRCSIDVKVAQSEPYALFVKEGCVSADYYVLGHLAECPDELDWLTVEFYGMAAREGLRSAGLTKTPYDHDNYVIPIEHLEPLPEPAALKPVG